ncbi:MAG: quinolinate synthase NadA [Paludibacteraceae bacterium]|nr:quinolinate synthase NadA [Paludibacteraceae bacterium]
MDKIQLMAEIKKISKQKNAVIMAHYYQENDIQDVADFIGDSLALAQKAATTTADIIVICGVHFMGETAKIICPDKKVLVPEMNAGCSLADSCKANDLKQFIDKHPDHTVISYVNTSAEVKALTDIVVTSTNAKNIVDMLPKDTKIIFGPDRNLGNYINSVTGRNMLLWDGACHVHEQFSLNKLLELKKQFPNAKTLAHPECKQQIVNLADVVGSTQALLNYATNSQDDTFIVATESGILHEMKKQNPNKTFIPLPTDNNNKCNECNYMRMNTLEKLYQCLLNETNEIIVDENISKKAIKSINRMLEMSK